MSAGQNMPELEMVDLRPRPFRWPIGLKPLEPAEWILVDGRYDEDLAEKRALYEGQFADVVAVLPETEGPATEVLAALLAQLDAVAPDRARAARAVIAEEPDRHPIATAGLLVQEDLCLHTMVNGELVLSAASVCFPTRWRMPDKLGQPLRAIHAPVPHYTSIGDGVDRIVAKLGAARGVWRANWSVMDDPGMFQAPGTERRDPSPITIENVGQRLWLRIERQTLRRFPEHDSVLFTIRLFQRPFADLVARPNFACDLASTMRALPDDVIEYKSLRPFYDVATAWLDAASASASGGVGPT